MYLLLFTTYLPYPPSGFRFLVDPNQHTNPPLSFLCPTLHHTTTLRGHPYTCTLPISNWSSSTLPFAPCQMMIRPPPAFSVDPHVMTFLLCSTVSPRLLSNFTMACPSYPVSLENIYRIGCRSYHCYTVASKNPMYLVDNFVPAACRPSSVSSVSWATPA